MTTRDEVRYRTKVRDVTGQADRQARYAQAFAIRACYLAGNATLRELGSDAGLSHERIRMIVKEGEEG